jgi:hypothetical protein
MSTEACKNFSCDNSDGKWRGEMSVLQKPARYNFCYLADVELIDKRFDMDGVIYSGFIPKPEGDCSECVSEPEQKPLTELERKIRDRWNAHKDPVLVLRVGSG